MGRFRLFFACDIHGSTLAYRRILNVPKFHEVDLIIISGDLCGKSLTRIVTGGTYIEVWDERGLVENDVNPAEVDQLSRNFENNGRYIFRCDKDLNEKVQNDHELCCTTRNNLAIERLKFWLKLARDKVDTKKVKIVFSPGNDDPKEIDAAIASHIDDDIMWAYNSVITVNKYDVLTVGDSNITPFKTPREKREEDLQILLDNLFQKVKNPKNSICNIHCPPNTSKLDIAEVPSSDKLLFDRSVRRDHVGSTAVRKALEKYQPMIGLHGHVHESAGIDKIGRTVCFNPGSDYSSGTLTGFLIHIQDGNLEGYQWLTT
ncbi:MAG: hypothetical protein V3V99_11145 [candidate division Zixibacteria bacterium]